jgi:organic hydroperoxide reductase OsmC/OhrA
VNIVGEEPEPECFPVKLVWTGGKSGNLTVEGKVPIRTGVPPGGPQGVKFHSPEDLFVASATICYMNGFVEFAKKMRIEFKSFECDAGIHITASVRIGSEDIRKRIERALDLAAKYCFIGNSMKCPVSHDTHIVVE